MKFTTHSRDFGNELMETYVMSKITINTDKYLYYIITYVIIIIRSDYMANVYNGRGYFYSIQYHIVWCVKYRHKILTTQIEIKLIGILNEIVEDNNFNILEINGEDIYGILVTL